MPPIRPPLAPRPNLRVPIIVQCTSDVAEILTSVPANDRLWEWHSNGNANTHYFALPSKTKNIKQGYTFGCSNTQVDFQLGPNRRLSRLHFRVSKGEGEKASRWTLFHRTVNHICVNGTLLPGQMRHVEDSEEAEEAEEAEESEETEESEPFEWKITLATEFANHVQLYIDEEVYIGFYLHVYGDPRECLAQNRLRETKKHVSHRMKIFAKRRWHHAQASLRKLVQPHGLGSFCSPKNKERLLRSIQRLQCALQASTAPVRGSEAAHKDFVQFCKKIERKVKCRYRAAFVFAKLQRARIADRRQNVKTKAPTPDCPIIPIITINAMVLTHRPKPR